MPETNEETQQTNPDESQTAAKPANVPAKDTAKTSAKIYDGKQIRRLTTYLRPYRPAVALSIVLLIVHSLLGVTGPNLTKVAVDR